MLLPSYHGWEEWEWESDTKLGSPGRKTPNGHLGHFDYELRIYETAKQLFP